MGLLFAYYWEFHTLIYVKLHLEIVRPCLEFVQVVLEGFVVGLGCDFA